MPGRATTSIEHSKSKCERDLCLNAEIPSQKRRHVLSLNDPVGGNSIVFGAGKSVGDFKMQAVGPAFTSMKLIIQMTLSGC
jgi:hypothetical protein